MRRRFFTASLLLFVSISAFVLQGYHPGAEDDAVYLSAIKRDVSPSLYPFNSQFFTLQMQATVFDKVVADFANVSHVPVPYVCLGLQIICIFLLLAGCWSICAFCFESFRARLAGVLTIACLLTLPVAGTALYISDEHLHPRLVATDAILFAIVSLQKRKPAVAIGLLIAAFLFHPMMAVFGISFAVLFVITRKIAEARSRQPGTEIADDGTQRQVAGRAALSIGGWLFSPATPAWRQAVMQHSYYLITRWAWYEWLGALAPPVLLWLLARLGQSRRNSALFHLAAALSVYSVLQLAVAMAMLLPPGLERLVPLQPMRYLHLTFLLMALLAGAALGEYVLKSHILRWLVVFLPLAGVNGYAQRLRYPATRNLELPWLAPQNPWVQAFVWVKMNTPPDAVFALDPGYLALPGEDNHSFRALAERSSLVDDTKDAAVVTQVPMLAETWVRQHAEQQGWRDWTTSKFAQLAQTSPVSWVVVQHRQATGLDCPYENDAVSVCRLR